MIPRRNTQSGGFCPEGGVVMRRHSLALPGSGKQARFAGSAVALVAVFAVLFLFPAPEPYIDTEIRIIGLQQEQVVSLSSDQERGLSVDWVSTGEAVLSIVAPRRATIQVLSHEGAIGFTIHELILYGERKWPTSDGEVAVEILSGKVVDWDPGLLTEIYVSLYDNRFVLALLAASSLAYLFVRSHARYRRLGPLVLLAALLVYQVLFYFDLTPTLYWDTPLLDPWVRSCLLAQMALSVALVAAWFPLSRLVRRSKPDLADGAQGFVERYGLLILVALPLLQHLLGNVVFGYNLQPTDARYTYMDWGRAMLDRGFLAFFSGGLLRRMDTPLLSAVWALFYGPTRNGYLASALVPLLYMELAIISAYLLCREFLESRAAFYAGLFLALSPLFSYASYFVMSDVASAAMSALTLWLFAVALRRDSLGLAVASGVSLFLTVVTKLTAIYCSFLVVVIYLFSKTRRARLLLVSFAFLVLLPLSFVAPYFLKHGLSTEALQASQEHLAVWAKVPMYQDREGESEDWKEMVLKSGQTHYYMGPVPRLFYFRYLVNGVGFPIVLWGLLIPIGHFEGRRGGAQGSGFRLWALALWILPLLLFMSLWSMRNTRFSYVAFPAYAMLGAYGFVLFKRTNRNAHPPHTGLLLGVSIIMLVTQSAAHYYNVSYLKNADYRDPLFIESSEPYYYIHRYYSGWHVGWTGRGADHQFTGSISTDGRFEDVRPFELEEKSDVLEVSESETVITFDAWARGKEDGCDFVIDGGSWVTFDLYIDGIAVPDRVYVYRGSVGIKREVAATLPLTLAED
jgi:hypothetical protein